jgi:hypothetical protein
MLDDLGSDFGIVRFGQRFDSVRKLLDGAFDLFVVGQQKMEDVTIGIMSLVVLFSARAFSLHPAAAPRTTETRTSETGTARAHATTKALAASWARLGLHIASGHPRKGGNEGEVDQRTRSIMMIYFHDRVPREGCRLS